MGPENRGISRRGQRVPIDHIRLKRVGTTVFLPRDCLQETICTLSCSVSHIASVSYSSFWQLGVTCCADLVITVALAIL